MFRPSGAQLPAAAAESAGIAWSERLDGQIADTRSGEPGRLEHAALAVLRSAPESHVPVVAAIDEHGSEEVAPMR